MEVLQHYGTVYTGPGSAAILRRKGSDEPTSAQRGGRSYVVPTAPSAHSGLRIGVSKDPQKISNL